MNNQNIVFPPISDKTKKFWQGSCHRVKQQIISPKMQNMTQAFFSLYNHEKSYWKRYSLSFAYALENEPVVLIDDEYLVGQTYTCGHPEDKNIAHLWEKQNAAYFINNRLKNEIPELIPLMDNQFGTQTTFSNCSPGHIGWHWDWIVKDGITGLFKQINNTKRKADDIGLETLDCMEICLESVLNWNKRHIFALKNLLANATETEKETIQEKIEICARVPLNGARNFREAVQAFHLSYLATMFENPAGGNGPGRMDYYLWPYLEQDLNSGKETLQSAREIIDELFIRFHERLLHTRDGHVETIVVGGCQPNGESAVNPLSQIMIESIASLNISHPSVYIRVPEKVPDDFIELASKDLCHGGNRAQIVNDKSIIEAMTRNGHIPLEDARMYMCGGCMELSPQGMNSDLLFCGFFNVLKVLEYVLTEGHCLVTNKQVLNHLTKDLSDYKTFDDLFNSFTQELTRILNLTFKFMDITSEIWAEKRPNFLVSSQVDDCISKGRGINNGGARYEDYGSTPLGLPNVSDSLFAIKKAVFEQKTCSAKELLTAMHHNFENSKLLHQQLKHLPKYGQGNQEADEMMSLINKTVCSIYDNYTNRLNGKVKPMIMTFMMAPIAGAAVGATADGRLCHQPIAQGISPQSNAMTEGITTAMLSQSKTNISHFSGGASSMWDIDSKFATVDNMKALLQTFLNTGGQMFQGNTTDIKELIKAQQDPDNYNHLMVRIGGYSGKFVNLNQDIQEEIINRHRHNY